MASLPQPIPEEDDEETVFDVPPSPGGASPGRPMPARRASVAWPTAATGKATNQRSPGADDVQQSPLAAKPTASRRRMSLAMQPKRRGSVSATRRASVTWNGPLLSPGTGSVTPRPERGRRQSVAQLERSFQPIVRRRKQDRNDPAVKLGEAEQALKEMAENFAKTEQEKEEMRKQYSQLQERSASAQSQMERTQRLLDRIRRENLRKTTEIDKLQQEFTSLGDRLKMLENKAMEVEKLEITVDSLKKALESSQQDFREAERLIRHLERKVDEKDKIINSREAMMKEFEQMSSDLKLQIREEVIKNTNLEMRIENTERLHQVLAEKEDEIKSLKKELEEANLLTQHARKCLREEKEKRKYLESLDRDVESMRQEVQIVSSENNTLKRLLAAKDVLLRQKVQTLQNLQNILRDYVTPQQFRNIMRNVEVQVNDMRNLQSSQKEFNGTSCKSIQGINGTDHSESGFQSRDMKSAKKTLLLRTILRENNSRPDATAPQRPRTAIVKPRLYQESFSNFRSESPASSDVTSAASDVSSVLRRTQSMRSSALGSRTTVTSSSVDSVTAWAARRNEVKVNGCALDETSGKVTWSDRHARTTQTLEPGDRVVFEAVSGKGDSQSKEYCTGVVKYIGHLDNEKDPKKIFVGLKLDEPDGDTDGLHKGKRYFRVSTRHGKFIRIDRIRSIFNKESGEFKSTENTTLTSRPHSSPSQQHKTH